jgi:hypothetical protein
VPSFDLANATIPEVLDYVDGDEAIAAEVLAAEQARGDDARKSLIEALEKHAPKQDPPTRTTQDDGRPPLAEVAVDSYIKDQPRPADVHGAPKED